MIGSKLRAQDLGAHKKRNGGFMHGSASSVVTFKNQPIPSLDQLFMSAVTKGDLVGGVALASGIAELIYAGCFGWRNREADHAMRMDDVFMLASLTKTITAVGAMQLVERGKVALDEPLGGIVSELANPKVLEGFALDGSPVLRPARNQITLRHLLSHTSGFGHDIWNEELLVYQRVTQTPGLGSHSNAGLLMPLLCDPGEQWHYSTGLEWTGKVIEAVTGQRLGVYLRETIFDPLAMVDTGFGILPQHAGRVTKVYRRESEGQLSPTDFASAPGEYEAGGGGLYGTAQDYLKFLRMLLNEGSLGTVRLLKPDTVRAMNRNQIGDLAVTKMHTAQPSLSNDFELYPRTTKKWGLAYMITEEPIPQGRAAHSLTWGGLANCFFWIDPTAKVVGLFLTQVLPFGDAKCLNVFEEFEHQIYSAIQHSAEGQRH
jgi:methyl acetate hydrolase